MALKALITFFGLLFFLQAFVSQGESTKAAFNVECGQRWVDRVPPEYVVPETAQSTGQISSINKEAWAAGIMISDKDGYRLLCSGTILDAYYIVTAGHCKVEAQQLLKTMDSEVLKQNLTIILGVSNPTLSNSKIKIRKGEIRKIESFDVHEKYDSVTAYFDIGLIKVSEKIVFKKNIWPICLEAKANNDVDEYISDLSLDVIGYGPLDTG